MSVVPTDAQTCNEKLLSDLLNENTSDISPQSRNEAFLLGLINKVVPDITPVSRVECYLKALCEKNTGNYLTDKDLDTTLKEVGKAADAAAVGDALSTLSEEIADLELGGNTGTLAGIQSVLTDIVIFLKAVPFDDTVVSASDLDAIQSKINALGFGGGSEEPTETVSATFSDSVLTISGATVNSATFTGGVLAVG